MSYLKRPNTAEAYSPTEFLHHDYSYSPATMTYKPYLLREDGEQKIPLFLIKLWNIVEDPAYREIVRWDETGLSFHIMDPYAFCSNILPQYFKHKNLNSLVRQLNMYGFRKNTPLDRSGLTRAESDQDHLEFLHPYFRRDHPELLVNIKRKVANKQPTTLTAFQQQQQLQTCIGDGSTVAVHTSDLTNIFDELKSLRDRQKNMEMRMEELTKENEMVWTEMAHIRGTHLKQQQIVNKLIQFLVALVAPGKQHQSRLGKRHMYVLEDGVGGAADAKRSRGVETDSHDSAAASGGGFGDFFASGDGTFWSGPQSGAGGGIPSDGQLPNTFSSGRSVNVSARNDPAHQAANQLQSILPANATEILDRLINEIGSSAGTFGASGSGNFMNGHHTINDLKHRLHHRSGSTAANSHRLVVDPLIVDDVVLGGHHHGFDTVVDDTQNNQQLQPYTGGSSAGLMHSARAGSGSAGSLSTSSSGPIIAEVTDELDLQQLGAPAADTSGMGPPCAGGAMFQVGGTGRSQQQPQMAVVVSSNAASSTTHHQQPMTTPLGQQQQQQSLASGQGGVASFRGYSNSFGGSPGAPPVKKSAAGYQDQRKTSQTVQIVQPRQQQQPMQRMMVSNSKNTATGFPQTPMYPQQQQQKYSPPTVIYSPISPAESPMAAQMPQQQQAIMIPMSISNQFQPQQQQQQLFQQPIQMQRQAQQQQPQRQCPTTPPATAGGGRYMTTAGNGAQQQQQQMVTVNNNNASSPLIAQPPSSNGSSQPSPTGVAAPLDVPLTDGMVLNEQEMAEIAGLNAFLEKATANLDENGTRFQYLTDSIGEHWDSVGVVDPADLDFQDLLEDYDAAGHHTGTVQALGGQIGSAGEQQQQIHQTQQLNQFAQSPYTNEPQHFREHGHSSLNYPFNADMTN